MEDDLRHLMARAEAQDALLRTFELDCVCQEFLYDPAGQNPWFPFPQPTHVHILVDERESAAPHRRFRAEYHPQVVRWFPDAAAHANKNPSEQKFSVSTQTEIGDGHQITSYRERRWRPSVHRNYSGIHLTGEPFLLCRFGRRTVVNQIDPAESEPVRLARALLEPERFRTPGIVEARTAGWETLENGSRVLRLEQVFTRGGRHVYHLDPERGFALLRFAEAEAGEDLETVFEVQELSQVADDFWFPARVSSSQLCPSPRATSPVRVRPRQQPTELPLGAAADEVVHWATTHRARLPKEDFPRCEYTFSNVRVGIDVPPDAFEFHPPPA